MSPQNPDIESTAGGAVEDKALDKESVIELLGEDEKEQETIELGEPSKKGKPEKPERTEKEDKEVPEKEEELSLEEELEQELEEPKEEDLELIEPPKRKEILAAFPDLFKKFPQLEQSMYREREYSKILPTLDDARQAVEKSETLDTYEREIMSGSTESLLTTVKDNDKEAFAKLIDNYLPNLYKVDQHSYYHTIGNVIKHTIISMVRDSKDQNNEELSQAAAIINQYMFGTNQFTHPQKLSKEDVAVEGNKEKEEEINKREKEFLERQFDSARNDLGTKVDNILKASVDRAIDPNNSMTEYVKRNATREVLEGLESLVSKDTRFLAIYDKLWERAIDSEFNSESLDTIKSAYLSKARTLLPILIRRARNEALRGLNRKVTDDTEKDKRGHLPVGKTRTSTSLASGSAKGNEAKQIPKGMSTLDYLSQD